MLRRLRDFQSWTVETCDDRVVGRVDDFFLDDQRWTVRYIAVNTGRSVPERQVLVSTLSIEGIDWDGMRIVTELTREQWRRTPSGGARGAGAAPSFHRHAAEARIAAPDEKQGLSLHSVHAVRGWQVHGPDGQIGCIEDVLADDERWAIPYFTVDAGQWNGGTMLVPPERIRRVDWKAGMVHVDLAREALRSRGQYDSRMDLHRAHEEQRP